MVVLAIFLYSTFPLSAESMGKSAEFKYHEEIDIHPMTAMFEKVL